MRFIIYDYNCVTSTVDTQFYTFAIICQSNEQIKSELGMFHIFFRIHYFIIFTSFDLFRSFVCTSFSKFIVIKEFSSSLFLCLFVSLGCKIWLKINQQENLCNYFFTYKIFAGFEEIEEVFWSRFEFFLTEFRIF